MRESKKKKNSDYILLATSVNVPYKAQLTNARQKLFAQCSGHNERELSHTSVPSFIQQRNPETNICNLEVTLLR